MIFSFEIFGWVMLAGYLIMSYSIVPKAVLQVSKRSVNPDELKWVKALIIVFSPLAMTVILWSKK